MALEKGGNEINTPKIETPSTGKDTTPEIQKKESANLDGRASIGNEKPKQEAHAQTNMKQPEKQDTQKDAKQQKSENVGKKEEPQTPKTKEKEEKTEPSAASAELAKRKGGDSAAEPKGKISEGINLDLTKKPINEGNAGKSKVSDGIKLDPTEKNTGNIQEGNAGNAREGNAGNVREGNAGNVRESNAGNAREGNAGNAREGNAGNVREGNAGNVREGNAGNVRDGNTVNDGNNPNGRDDTSAAIREALKEKLLGPVKAGWKAAPNALGIMTNTMKGDLAGAANSMGKLYNNLREFNPEPAYNSWDAQGKEKWSDKLKPYFDAFGDGQKYVDQQEQNGGKKRGSFERLMEASLYAAGGEQSVKENLTPGKRVLLRGLRNLADRQ